MCQGERDCGGSAYGRKLDPLSRQLCLGAIGLLDGSDLAPKLLRRCLDQCELATY